MADDVEMPDAPATENVPQQIAPIEQESQQSEGMQPESQQPAATEPEPQPNTVADADDTEKDDPQSSDEDGDEGESDPEPFLAVTRERRANAGNRMARLLELAEAEQATEEEEYGEIFQETANDQEFEEDDDNDEDVNMESSSEEEEAEGEQDDDAAEKELKRQEKRENAKKQKRQSLLQQMMKKRTSAAAASASAVASGVPDAASTMIPTRPRKKSERVSWLPEEEQQATRASSRKLAIISKQATTERLKQKEKHRLRTVEIMKAAEQRKEAAKPKAMTQADRLAEAARIERENSKSVRKWEEIEKKKEEERKAKIAASKNRKLEGPVISYWSGPALWVGDRRTHVGRGKVIEEVLAERRRAGKIMKSTAKELNEPEPVGAADNQPSVTFNGSDDGSSKASTQAKPDFLDGIHFYASLPSQEQSGLSPSQAAATTSSPAPSVAPSTAFNDSQSGATLSEVLCQQNGHEPPREPMSTQIQFQPDFSHQYNKPLLPERPIKEVAARSLITLQNFDLEPKTKDRDALLKALLSTPDEPYNPPTINKWAIRLMPARKPSCAVVDKTARYRDPRTGLPYYDTYSLKMIRRLTEGKFIWSETLECWLGGRIKPATGVPPGFADPEKVKRKDDITEGEKMDTGA